MTTLDQFYWNNPISTIDQNQWQLQYPQVEANFRVNSLYTPLVDWTSELTTTHSQMGTIVTELLEGETDFDEVPLTATTIDAQGVDSRARTFTYGNYAGKVQLNRKSNIFNMWNFKNGSNNDWTPILRGLLGNDVLQKHEMLSRNIYMRGPKERWTTPNGAFALGTNDWSHIDSGDTFQMETILDWNFRMGNTGSPIIPGAAASAKLCIVPPGVNYALRKSLASASGNEASMWRNAREYAGMAMNYEIGEFSNVRFQEAPPDRFGLNPAILYNCGKIKSQFAVVEQISMGDGAPDPAVEKVDDVWMVGQKAVKHYIQLESGASLTGIEPNDYVTIHLARTSVYGVTNGVDPLASRGITRRVIKVDNVNKRLTFDRPVLFNYNVPFVGASVTGGVTQTSYAWVTKAVHIAFVLALGSKGGTLGAVAQPLQFYEPVAVDDRQQIWRFVYDMTLGYNMWEPNFFECHFCAVAVPKPGGVIAAG